MTEKESKEQSGAWSQKFGLTFSKINAQVGDKKLLHDVSGVANSGEITALMGPSGAGKTTLLNSLCGRTMMMKDTAIEGYIALGSVSDMRKIKRHIGYVMQQDIFIANISVRETINFYAGVQLPDKFTKAQKRERALQVIRMLGLEAKLETLVGDNIIRGLSGGEKKRLSIAVELITDPRILFLDEPTTGLDSGYAFSVIKSLQTLAHEENKIIISSIHQPNSPLFQLFDKLILLAHGHCLFYGPLCDLSEFLSNAGFVCPKGWNIADHMIDVSRQKDDVLSKLEKLNIEKNSDLYNTLSKCDASCGAITESKRKKRDKVWRTSFWNQFKANFRREFVRSVTSTYTFLSFFEFTVLAIIIGVLWLQTPFTDKNYATLIGLFFYICTSAFIQPLFYSIFSFLTDGLILRRENMSHLYRLSAFYTAKSVSELPSVILRPTIIGLLVYWMTGLWASAIFLPTYLVVIIQGIYGHTIGLLFSSLGLAFKETGTLLAVYFTIVFLVGGLFNPNIPDWLSWIRYISPLYYAYSLIYYMQIWASNGLKCEGIDSPFKDCVNGAGRASIESVLALGNIDLPLYAYFILYIGILLIAKVATYFFLRGSLKRAPLSTGIDFKLFKNENFSKGF